jgi:UDP:flavonoid glycosyltransferase YjiC (YdhE family)
MRILFTSTRGAGHLLPLLPYLHCLKERGHKICVAAPDSVGEKLQKEGLPHSPFDHPGDEKMKPIWARYRDLSGDEASALALREIFAGLVAQTALPKLLEIIRTWHPDIIVRESVEFAGLIAAEKEGIPHSRVAVHNGFFEEILMLMAYPAIDSLRQNFGLNSDNGKSLRDEPVFTSFPASLDGATLAGMAPFRVGRPQPTTSLIQTVPAWVPKNNEVFIYITFGTIAGSSLDRLPVYRATISAVEDLPIRVLLTTGPNMDISALGTIPNNVTVEAWVPQDEVWPHTSAHICHGGSGTVLGGLAAGMPMVVIPFFGDQLDNAKRVQEVGAGIAVFEPDVSSIKAAIEQVLVDNKIRETVGQIEEEMSSMPSIDDAVDDLLLNLNT